MGYVETLGDRDCAIPDLFETLRPPENIRVLPLAILLSLMINAGLLFLWQGYLPGVSGEIETGGDVLEVHLQSVDPVPVSPEKEIRHNTLTPPAEAVVETTVVDRIEQPGNPSSAASPVAKAPTTSKDWKELLSAPMVTEFMRNRDFSSPPNEFSHQNQGSGFEDVFRADLRRKLREQSKRSGPVSSVNLNNSTVSDAYERVAVAGKCFTLEPIADGRIDQKLWYTRKCVGKTSLSETMAQAIRDRMNHTNLRK